MNKPLIHGALIAFGIIAPLLGAWSIHERRDNFSCQIQAVIVDENSAIDVSMNYTLRNGRGIYESSGEYREKGKPPEAISNKITFNYWNESDKVIMVSNETNALPKKPQAFRDHTPDFFHRRDRGISLKILPANDNSYLFLYDGLPVFFCSKS